MHNKKKLIKHGLWPVVNTIPLSIRWRQWNIFFINSTGPSCPAGLFHHSIFSSRLSSEQAQARSKHMPSADVTWNSLQLLRKFFKDSALEPYLTTKGALAFVAVVLLNSYTIWICNFLCWTEPLMFFLWCELVVPTVFHLTWKPTTHLSQSSTWTETK